MKPILATPTGVAPTGEKTVLLLLEDNAERLERFAAVLRTIEPGLPVRVWRDARVMIREAGPLLGSARLISLDHDLEPEPGEPDLGDGYLVVKRTPGLRCAPTWALSVSPLQGSRLAILALGRSYLQVPEPRQGWHSACHHRKRVECEFPLRA